MPSSSARAVRAVVDSNVLVSGLLGATGPSARIVDLILSGVIEPVLSDEILEEYRRVLSRQKLGLPPPRIEALLEFLEQFVLPLSAPALRICSDPDDDKFLAAALDGGAQWLIPGNVRHYPTSPYQGVVILPPAEAHQKVARRQDRSP